MIDLLLWWLFISIIGVISFPITYYFFNNFRTKGLVFSKILGLLFFGFIYWLGNLTGLLGNNWKGASFSVLILVMLSVLIIKTKISLPQIFLWARDNIRSIIYFELLIICLGVLIAFLRGTNPAIIGTEKPMEMAFVNAIMRSENFPPNDPWLSGYAISYYYFGYLVVVGIIKMMGTPSGVAFNLSLIFWFSLSGAAVGEITINLILDRETPFSQASSKSVKRKAYLLGVIAALFLLVISNGEGLLELLHSLGVFWESTAGNLIDTGFWRWFDIQELTNPPTQPFDWDLRRPGGIWWWRASRVLQDYTVAGHSREIIDEFPFFSFLLGDLHPHVLAIPFVLLNIAAAYSLLKRKITVKVSSKETLIGFWSEKKNWFLPIILGCLIFVNTWDFPIYFGLFSFSIFTVIRAEFGNLKKAILDTVSIVISLAVFSIILFMPFLISFSSQAGGILPSLVFQSRSIHLLVMFFPFVGIILIDMVSRSLRKTGGTNFLKIFLITAIAFLFVQAMVYFFSWLLVQIPQYIQKTTNPELQNWAIAQQIQTQNFINIYSGISIGEILQVSINRFAADPVDVLILLFSISFGLKIAIFSEKQSKKTMNVIGDVPEKFYGLILVLAALLILVPEVIYLRDQFGWRMNTIFKFYYQAWIMFSIATAYALSRYSKKIWAGIKWGLAFLGIIAGLVYPVYAIKDRVDSFNENMFNFDGNAYLAKSNAAEFEAIQFLNSIPTGVISEAVGGSYSNYARVSKLTGLPTVLGWPGHELQWRGGSSEIGTREPDIKTLYTTNQWYIAEEILDKYQIRYIYIGGLERATYNVSDEKFEQNLSLIFMNEAVRIFENVDHAS